MVHDVLNGWRRLLFDPFGERIVSANRFCLDFVVNFNSFSQSNVGVTFLQRVFSSLSINRVGNYPYLFFLANPVMSG